MKKSSAATATAVSAGIVVGCAGGAATTSVIGVGNAAFSNSCTNTTRLGSQGETTAQAGSLTGLNIAVPLTDPTNQCGTLGVPNRISHRARLSL